MSAKSGSHPLSTISWTTPSPPTGTLPTDVTVKRPVPGGTVNEPATTGGAVTTATGGGRAAAAGAWATVVGCVVGAVLGTVVGGAVVVGALVLGVVGAVEGRVVGVLALVVTCAVVLVAAGVAFFVVTAVVGLVVTSVGAFVVTGLVAFVVTGGVAVGVVFAGSVESVETVAAPFAPSGAPETGKMIPPARAARNRIVTSRRTPRVFERCIHTIGMIDS